MTPAELSAASFRGYGPAARQFAIDYLSLLQQLPLALCPSFLHQISTLDTSFPAERAALLWQCASLRRLPQERFRALIAPLEAITLNAELAHADWVEAPGAFVAALTAHLWSSGQLDRFRMATQNLFAAIPQRKDETARLVVVVLARELGAPSRPILKRLARQGVSMTALQGNGDLMAVAQLCHERAQADAPGYAHWYVDGGAAVAALATVHPQLTTLSYAGVAPLRQRVLQRMQKTLQGANGGPEQMRDRLADTTPGDVQASGITPDPVLQRFYTDLFTQSSGPQIFSTSFVQWSGREIARRVQPSTLVLRYTARQQNRDMNQLLATADEEKPDPEGSFRDAEMGAYYNWIEMDRITAPGKLTFVALLEGQMQAVVVSARAAAGTVCTTPLSLRQGLELFG